MISRHRTGADGEEAAARHLHSLGMTILVRNWRQGRMELDMVCRDNDTIVFVEVRTRNVRGMTTPMETLTPAKQRHVLRAARAWLTENDQWHRPCRCDVVSVLAHDDPATFSVEHYPHVLELDLSSHSLGCGHTPWQPW